MDSIYFLFPILLGSTSSSSEVIKLEEEKIVGASYSRIHRFKYVVALMYKLPGNPDVSQCAGGILSNWYIVTAAHCFYNKLIGGIENRLFYIIAGSHDLNREDHWTRNIQVDLVIIHKTYNPNYPDTYFAKGNLAMVKLKEGLRLHPNNQYLSQLVLRQQPSKDIINAIYHVAGYGWKDVEIVLSEVNGRTEYVQTGTSDGKLRYAKVKILPNFDCWNLIKDYIAPGNMCAKSQRVDHDQPIGICKGDSGAPLSHSGYLDGIAINGFMSCDEEELPGVYINVFYYRAFIQQSLASNRTKDMYILKLQEIMPAMKSKAEKIIGGTIARIDQFKYVVALMYKLPGNPDVSQCAGSILSNRYIITVAHCFYNKSIGGMENKLFYIIAGVHNLNREDHWTREIPVDHVIIHKTYNPNYPDSYFTKGNLAMVKLKENLGLLPSNQHLTQLIIRQQPFKDITSIHKVAGYGWKEVEIVLEEVNGRTEYVQTGKSDGKLRYAKVKILPNFDCWNLIKDYIAPGNMCAESQRIYNAQPVGICKGDSGAPLTHSGYLDGIAINGFMSCNEEELPGIYVNVFYYRAFIQKSLAGIRSNDMYILKLQEIVPGQYDFIEI